MRPTILIGSAVLGLACIIGAPGFSQDKGDQAPVVKGQLPKYWNKIGLSDEQKQKIYSIHSTYAAKIDTANKQIKSLKAQEKSELEKLLTDDQKTALRRILLEKAPKTDTDKKTDNK